MTNKYVNGKAIFEKWSPVIAKTTKVSDVEKLKWMSQVAQNQKIYEDATYGTINEDIRNIAHVNPDMNIGGMGAVTLPGDPSYSYNFRSQTPGSGDKAQTLLPLAMQVAAQTIALDLVSVTPMPGPMGMLSYLDYTYAGGTLKSKEAPLVIKVPLTLTTGVTALTAGTTYFASISTTSYWRFTYVGNSRIDGFPIFRVIASNSDGTARAVGAAGDKSIDEVITSGDLKSTAGGSVVAAFASSADLVKALEDHLPGFSSRAMSLGDGVTNAEEPYLREEGESTAENMMGLTLRSQAVSAQTYQVGAMVTREQLDDLRQYNIDAMGQLEAILANELTQTINRLILSRMFRMGVTSAAKWFQNSGENFNVNVNSADSTINIGVDTEGNPVSMQTKKVNTTLGGESVSSIQRGMMTMILAAAHAIGNHTRRGNGNFVVTNYQVATVLQSVAGFTAYPLANTINQSSNSMYNIGSISGIQIYVDPNMSFSDTRVLVGRKGDGNSSGLVFMPYLMAQSTSIIAESTMAPKIAVKSRFALVEAGHYPEDNYLVFKINSGDLLNNLLA